MDAQQRVAAIFDDNDLHTDTSRPLAAVLELDVDAEAALETSLSKYETRLDDTGRAGSGE